jgi:hypothetical protein
VVLQVHPHGWANRPAVAHTTASTQATSAARASHGPASSKASPAVWVQRLQKLVSAGSPPPLANAC